MRMSPRFRASLVRTSVVAALLATASIGCGSTTDPATPPSVVDTVDVARSELTRNTSPAVDDAALKEVVQGNDAFAVDMYKRIANGKSAGKNLFFSPHSISAAFAMLHGGAVGTSKSDIAKTMHFTLPDETFHPAMNKLGLELESRANGGTGTGSDGKGFRLALENSFWGQKTYTWEKPYLDILGVNYGAGINLVDFAKDPEASRKTINLWTEEKTEKRIKELLPENSIGTDTAFVLVNTVYFNAAWLEEFQQTQMPFTNAAGTVSDVAGIIQSGNDFRYATSDEADIVAMPYEGRKIEFIAIVPKDIAAYEASLDAVKLEGLIGRLQPKVVTLTMPKFKIEGATISLKEELTALGMGSIFSDGTADFSGMTKSAGLVIDDVYHQAFVKLNEKGTEAAAATAIVGRETSAAVDPPIVVKVDRPYLFMVRDVPTGAILFAGRMLAPAYSE